MDIFTNYIKTHKTLASLGGVALVIIGYFYFFRTSQAEVQYVIAPVEKGTIVVSISGSGQVSASDQVDIKPKVSGNVTYVAPLITGQNVGAGTLIAMIDSKDAQKAVRDAQLNLQTAKLALVKLQNDQSSSQVSTNDTLTNTQNNLTKAYQDGFNAVATTFIHLPSMLNDARLALYGTQLSYLGCQPDYCDYGNLIGQADRSSFSVFIDNSIRDYATASASYNISVQSYNNTNHTADTGAIETIIDQTLKASQDLSQVMKSETTMLATLVSDIQKQSGQAIIPSAVTNYQTTLTNDLVTVNNQVSTLLSIQNTIINSKQSLASSQRSITSNTQGNSIDLQTQENTIAQREATLSDAQANLADYYVRAPFAGVLATLDVRRGDSASSAISMATVISPKQIAEVSLNEVDVAKVKTGQKATLTFDAISSLTLTGKVVSVDVIGTVTQNVVSYKVKVALDTQDPQIKPGMSVSVAIITQVKQDVLMVPNGAVKLQGGNSTVQTVSLPAGLSQTATITASQVAPSLKSVSVEVGLSNDTMTEIISDLKEGDEVITRTISATAVKATTSTSIFGGSNAGTGTNRRALQP